MLFNIMKWLQAAGGIIHNPYLALDNHQIETNEESNLTVDVDLAVCHSLTQGVAALFGPNSPYTAHHVQSICDSKEIPHTETRCDQGS